MLKATLVFLDESGFSLLPTPCKTWAPRGQTPLLYHCFNWPKLSAISAVTPRPNAYLRLVRGTITSPYVIEFVRHLLHWIPGTIFLFWDGLNTHRSKKTQAALAQHHPRLRIYRLPAYAPELNPVEYLWAYLKTNPLANDPALDVHALAHRTRRAARSVQHRQALLRSFFHHTGLSLRLR